MLGSGQQDVLPFVRGEVADQGGDEVVGGDVQAGAGGLAPGRVGAQAGEVDAVVEDDALVGQAGKLLLRRLADAEEAADVGQAAGLAHQGQRAAIIQDVVDVPEDGAAAEQGGQGAPEEGAAAVGVEELGVEAAGQPGGGQGQAGQFQGVGQAVAAGFVDQAVLLHGLGVVGDVALLQGVAEGAPAGEQYVGGEGQRPLQQVEQDALPAGDGGQRFQKEDGGGGFHAAWFHAAWSGVRVASWGRLRRRRRWLCRGAGRARRP